MYQTIFKDIKTKLSTIEEIKWVEWYLEQENQKGGIINTPCVLIKFEPAAIVQIAKTTKQANINFELLIYTDFKKANAKVGGDTQKHFEIEHQIETALSIYEQTDITPVERRVGLLKSSMTFISRTTACIPSTDGTTTVNKEDITPCITETILNLNEKLKMKN